MADFAVKTACLRKILHSIIPVTNTFMEKLFSGGGHDAKKVIELKNLRTALKDGFAFWTFVWKTPSLTSLTN